MRHSFKTIFHNAPRSQHPNKNAFSSRWNRWKLMSACFALVCDTAMPNSNGPAAVKPAALLVDFDVPTVTVVPRKHVGTSKNSVQKKHRRKSGRCFVDFYLRRLYDQGILWMSLPFVRVECLPSFAVFYIFFAFSAGLCLVCVLSVFLICLLSCIFQCEPTWMTVYRQIVLICH